MKNLGFGKLLSLLTFIILSLPTTKAQDFGFGIKAGLSFSTFHGDLKEGESYSYKSGFHVGPSFTLKFTDLFSIRAEFLYNQLGTEYEYNGPSYFFLRTSTGVENVFLGHKDMTQSSFLNYFDVPLQASFKIGNTFEFYGGVNFLILPGATGGGVIDWREPLAPGQNADDVDRLFRVRLDYGYNGDDVKGRSDGAELADFRYRRTTYELPSSLGAYYDHEEKDGRTYNTIDYGIHAGTRIFFNDALYLEGRFYYGLSDVTNNDMDIEQVRESVDPPRVFSDDVDGNLSIQISLGFTF